MENDPVVIVDAVRTPLGNFLGELKDVSATQLGKFAIQGLIQRTHLDPELINETLMGCVLPAGLGQAPARQAALNAGLPKHVGCTTVNKVCGSGMKAVMLGRDIIRAGSAEIIIAGGMESMSNSPYLLTKARAGYRIGNQTMYDHMFLDGLEDAYEKGRLMGYFAEDCAKHYKFTRQAQDEFATQSVLKAQKAAQTGSFDAEIVPVPVPQKEGVITISKDEGPLKAKIEKIPQLKPAFGSDGTITAANSSSISDGAAALLLMRESKAKELNLTPLAKIIGQTTHSQEPHWFTTAPVGAIIHLLEKLGWTSDQVDLFEINEAFAVVAMVTMQALKIPAEKINIHGGACVLGHPIGASGARILVTLLHALKQKNLKRGVASLCIGGGEATAMAVEMY